MIVHNYPTLNLLWFSEQLSAQLRLPLSARCSAKNVNMKSCVSCSIIPTLQSSTQTLCTVVRLQTLNAVYQVFRHLPSDSWADRHGPVQGPGRRRLSMEGVEIIHERANEQPRAAQTDKQDSTQARARPHTRTAGRWRLTGAATRDRLSLLPAPRHWFDHWAVTFYKHTHTRSPPRLGKWKKVFDSNVFWCWLLSQSFSGYTNHYRVSSTQAHSIDLSCSGDVF